MEAKDTVMSGKQIDAIVKNLTEAECITVEQAVAQTQAGISFRAGIREVVEWINKNVHLYIRNDNGFIDALEAKLKEWGL